MATINERPNSREFVSGPEPSARLHYVVTGIDDKQAGLTAQMQVLALVRAFAPVQLANLWREQAECKPQGGEVWYCEVPYGPYREDGEDEPVSEWSFNVGTTMVHTTHSIETINQYADGDAEDFAQAINVVGEGDDIRIEGVDVPTADLTWQETLYMPATWFTTAYLNILYNAVGKTNKNTFRIFEAQTVLLQGVSGRPAGKQVSLTFQFAASPSETGLSIGGITGIAKKGWEYLWVRSVTEGNLPVVKQVNVEKVIETYDFANLGIPDPFTAQ